MIPMSPKIRSFPETREEPRKKILAIPFILIFGGLGLTLVHDSLRFIGILISFTGVLTVFLVGMVFADLWTASRRTKDIIKAREKRMREDKETVGPDDPFIDTLEDSAD